MWADLFTSGGEKETGGLMRKIRQPLFIAGYNFPPVAKSPILVTFALTLIMSFLLTDKAVRFAVDHNTTMQMVESFIWSFGDSNSILLSSVLLVLLFADMPFLSSEPLLSGTDGSENMDHRSGGVHSRGYDHLSGLCSWKHHCIVHPAVLCGQYVESGQRQFSAIRTPESG